MRSNGCVDAPDHATRSECCCRLGASGLRLPGALAKGRIGITRGRRWPHRQRLARAANPGKEPRDAWARQRARASLDRKEDGGWAAPGSRQHALTHERGRCPDEPARPNGRTRHDRGQLHDRGHRRSPRSPGVGHFSTGAMSTGWVRFQSAQMGAFSTGLDMRRGLRSALAHRHNKLMPY
jgi:hypothetical protein